MFEFTAIEGRPDAPTLKKTEKFYASIFENPDLDKFARKILEAKYLLMILVFHRNKIVGFKIGYELDSIKFYSWVGGVDKDFRHQGIAAELMRRQHDWCTLQGYKSVQTKTTNQFKSMLVLNIKSGFDIIEVYSSINN